MKKNFIFIFVLFILLASFFLYGKIEIFYFTKITQGKILFVGDMNFDRYIRQVGENKGEDYVFSCISNFLKDSDLVIGNLEGPITDNPSVSMGSVIETPENYTFTFPSNTAKILAKNNIKLVNLGNNHIGNFGSEGIFSTENYLKKSGVNYIYNNKIFRTKIGNTNISFISYNEFSDESVEKVYQKILEEKNNGQMVLVYAHWGDEYVEAPERVKNYAKMFANSGADLIIGSHPHVILSNETLRPRSGQEIPVYYSLGNFIFDQYWNKEVSTGLVLEVNIKGDDIKIIEHRVNLGLDGRTCLEN
jgi:poly-gamma-glutamate synthesis protein (capsule biosynthesis protein)